MASVEITWRIDLFVHYIIEMATELIKSRINKEDFMNFNK